VTADGFETQFASNHLGPFALTSLLSDLLLAAPAARVVTVSALIHPWGRVDVKDLPRPQRYKPWSAYANTKLANLLFAYELDRRFKAAALSAVSVRHGPEHPRRRVHRATRWGHTRGPAGPERSSKSSQDPALAGELWARTEELTGITFPALSARA
jgi:NAD(P)-dependent dehydrogenase (short-subunit alcohol dehydrogenase family)